MQTKLLQWLVSRYPKNVQGVMLLMFLIIFTLVSVIMYQNKEKNALQKKVDDCNERRYQERNYLMDSLARIQQRDNERIQEENERLKATLKEFIELKNKK